MGTTIAAGLALVILVGVTRVARAADATNATTAQALFDEAKRLVEVGRYGEACPKLAESHRLDPAGGTLLHLAACHENQGKTATAWAEFNEALTWARRDSRADRELYARSRLDVLAPRLLTLTIAVPPGANEMGLTIKRDDRVLGQAEWGARAALDPGEHTIEATAPNRSKWTSRVRLDDNARSLVVTIPTLAAEVSGAPPRPDAAPTSPPVAVAVAVAAPAAPGAPPAPRSAAQTVGLVLGGLGALGLGAAIGFDVNAHRLASQRDDAARSGDATRTASLDRDAHRAENTAFIVGGAALAALGAGLTIYLWSPRPTVTALRVGPRVAQNQMGLFLEVLR